MNCLVLCPCSHGLDRHSEAGCAGTANYACACPLSAFEVLEEAVNEARSKYSHPPADGVAVHEHQPGG